MANEFYNEMQNLKKQFEELQDVFAFHSHNGTDSQQISSINTAQKKLYISHFIPDGTVALNYGVIFIAPFDCVVTKFMESHQVAGTDAGAVTLQLEKLTGTQALDSGVDILLNGNPTIDGVDLKGTADTVVKYPESVIQTGATYGNQFSQDITSNKKHFTLKTGDRLALKDIGVLTSVQGVTVMVELTY